MYSNLIETENDVNDNGHKPTNSITIQPQQPAALKPIAEEGRTRRISMPLSVPHTGPGGRRLSIPFSVQRRRSSYGNYSRIVMCAVDTNENSKDAFNWYLANVWRMDDLIVICYCPEPPSMPSFSFKTGLSLPTDRWKEILDEANDKIRKLEEYYEQMCIEKKLRYKIRGESCKNIGEGVCRIAEEECVNLIVLGTRGVSALKRAFIGSVSEYIVRNSNVPCLVVPMPK